MNLHVFNLDFRLKSGAEIHLYRMIQEMVNNTIKHANATQIEINLTRRDDILSLMYDDNGKGLVLDENMFFEGMGQKNINQELKNWVEL